MSQIQLQWGSDTQPFEIWKDLQSGLFFEEWIFKGLGCTLSFSYGPNHLKTGPFTIQTFVSRIERVQTKWRLFVRIS